MLHVTERVAQLLWRINPQMVNSGICLFNYITGQITQRRFHEFA